MPSVTEMSLWPIWSRAVMTSTPAKYIRVQNGKFMLRTSADEIAEKYPKAVQKVVDEALKGVFRGK